MDKDAGKGGRVLKVLAAVAVAFGLMTLKEGGAVLSEAGLPTGACVRGGRSEGKAVDIWPRFLLRQRASAGRCGENAQEDDGVFVRDVVFATTSCGAADLGSC